MTGITKMSPTKTGGSFYGSGMPGGLGGPAPFGGGIKAILAAAGVIPKSGLTVGSAALNKLDKKGGAGGQKSMTGKSYGTGSRRSGSRGTRSRKSATEDFENMDLMELEDLIH